MLNLLKIIQKMINIKEIRIGNYLLLIDENIFKQVYSINNQAFKSEIQLSDKHDSEEYHPIDLKGIPIKHEFAHNLLIKFGFEHAKSNLYNYYSLTEDKYRFDITYKIDDNDYLELKIIKINHQTEIITLDNIKYIHKLQNLFFNFTNKELQCTRHNH